MSNTIITSREIERWMPTSIKELAGNSQLKDVLHRYIQSDGIGPNVLITGEPGSGKTAAVKASIKALNCSTDRSDIS